MSIFFPVISCQKLTEMDDNKNFIPSVKMCMATEVAADVLSEKEKGYVFRVSGGNDVSL